MDIRQSIEDKNTALRNAYNEGNAADCVAVFADDAIMMPPNQSMVRGKEAVREIIQGWIDTIGGKISNPMVECDVDGDLAYQVATYAFTDTTMPDQGKFVEIFRRQQDGSWKVYLTIYNSDREV